MILLDSGTGEDFAVAVDSAFPLLHALADHDVVPEEKFQVGRDPEALRAGDLPQRWSLEPAGSRQRRSIGTSPAPPHSPPSTPLCSPKPQSQRVPAPNAAA